MGILQRVTRTVKRLPAGDRVRLPHLPRPRRRPYRHRSNWTNGTPTGSSTSSTDPLLPRISPRWQRRYAAERLDSGDWYVLVILHDDKVIGHFWAALGRPAVSSTESSTSTDRGRGGLRVRPLPRPGLPAGQDRQLGRLATTPSLRDRGVSSATPMCSSTTHPRSSGTTGWGSTGSRRSTTSTSAPASGGRSRSRVTPLRPLSRRGRFNDPERPTFRSVLDAAAGDVRSLDGQGGGRVAVSASAGLEQRPVPASSARRRCSPR